MARSQRVFGVGAAFATSSIWRGDVLYRLGKAKAEKVRKTIKASIPKWIVYNILFFFAVFGLADLVIVAAPYVWTGYLRLLAWLGIQVAQTLIAVWIVVIGFGAYKFKEATKKWYGFVEVPFSLVSVTVALKTTAPDNRVGLVITIIGAVYVSSRGFGNYFGKAD